MYKRGLQYAHKDLVNMEDMLASLCFIMQGLNNVDRLGETAYEHIVHTYKPFIEARMSWETLRKRYEISMSSDGWL